MAEREFQRFDYFADQLRSYMRITMGELYLLLLRGEVSRKEIKRELHKADNWCAEKMMQFYLENGRA